MLSRLYIRNYALIEELSVSLSSGFTVITGETGAGKSILMGALSLLSGKRADVSVLRNTDDKCVVEGSFILSPILKSIFDFHDLDFVEENIFRREISAAGKSRAFINDTPVNLDTLKEISALCFDIHSQHEVFALAKPSFRMDVCDAFADISPIVLEFKNEFKLYLKDKKEYLNYTENAIKATEELDYKKFLFSELETLNYKEGEQDELEQELTVLSNAGSLVEALQQANSLLQDADENTIYQLQQIKSILTKVSKDYQKIEIQNERLQSLIIDLKDISSELYSILEDVQPNPQRLLEVENRLSDIYSLNKKHRTQHGNELIAIMEDLSSWLDNFSDSEEFSLKWLDRLEKEEARLRKKALDIRAKRKLGAEQFALKVESTLHDLAMPHARFIGEVKELDVLNEWGMDEVNFWFTANLGQSPVELHKSASGGEMSRVMLAIKSVLAQKSSLAAIVFDEIDTGISGRVADKAAQIMLDLSAFCQVIAISHLPQIAAKGNSHFKVSKSFNNQDTQTRLHLLNERERIEELATMLSGEALSDAALQNAKSLLGIA